MKILGVAGIANTPGDSDIFRNNPDSLSVIYMSMIMEAKLCIVASNQKKKDEAKQNAVKKMPTSPSGEATFRRFFQHCPHSIVTHTP